MSRLIRIAAAHGVTSWEQDGGVWLVLDVCGPFPFGLSYEPVFVTTAAELALWLGY